MTSLVVTVRGFPHTPDIETCQIFVAVGVGGKDPKTRIVATLTGIERDYVDTLVQDATNAYLYEETPKDVVRAIADVTRLARKHARDHGL